MKHLVLIFIIAQVWVGLNWSYSTHASEEQNHTVAMAICKLSLENIELLRSSDDPEHWTRLSTATISLDGPSIYVDRTLKPSLNNKYFTDKIRLLDYLYS